MNGPDRLPAPRESAGAAPPRPPRSIRRTSTIDTDWPEGRTGLMRMVGRARDAVTGSTDSAPTVFGEDEFRARVQWDRTIVDIDSRPARPGIGRLNGARGGGHLRKILDEVLPDEHRGATPLYLLLDDISGASLVAGWAWSRWSTDWLVRPSGGEAAPSRPPMRKMEGVCIGFRPGSGALNSDGTSSGHQNAADVVDLRRADDPLGWHAFTEQKDVGMRRARRIDVWLDGLIQIDSAFQDSATNPKGGRTAVHEYRLSATADPVTLELLSVRAEPRVLPYAECPAAAANVHRLVGARLSSLRQKVLEDLRGTAGCTHLNDALRALAEVPALVERLRAIENVAA